MVEPKVNLNITLPGRVMFSKEECLKTTQVTYTDKRGRKRSRFIKVEDENNYEHSQIQLRDYKTNRVETIGISIRKCKNAHQSINISKESYYYMISKDSCVEGISKKHWDRMSKDQRLKAHLDEICTGLGGISYSYQVFEE